MHSAARSFVVLCWCALAAALATAASAPAQAQDRFAVVIGAQSYSTTIGVALGANADMSHVADALESEGFMVERVVDANEAALKRSLFWLVDRLSEAGEGAVGVFYFAGHGVQINDHTYLLPIDARTSEDLTLSGSALPGDLILERLSNVNGATALIVIDAASPNGLIERFDLEPGLAPLDRPEGGLVIFSHYPDQLSLPRQAGVSVFATAFAHLATSDEHNFSTALQSLRREVSDASGGSRYAWVSGRLGSRFQLGTDEAAAAADDEADGAGPSAGAPGGGRSLSPTPLPAAPSSGVVSETRSLSAQPIAEPGQDVHMVRVFFGADRTVEQRNGELTFTATSSPVLAYGVAEVSIPPIHETGQLESPRWWRFEFTPDPEKHVVYHGAEIGRAHV